eukprot:6189007-Pleurochrysis_carterae.AAC.2
MARHFVLLVGWLTCKLSSFLLFPCEVQLAWISQARESGDLEKLPSRRLQTGAIKATMHLAASYWNWLSEAVACAAARQCRFFVWQTPS